MSQTIFTIEVLNPSKWPRTGLITVKFNKTTKFSNLQIYNAENQEITSQIKLDRSGLLEFKFIANNIPSKGKKRYFIKKRDRTAEFTPPDEGLFDGNDYYLENDSLRIIIEKNGSFTIMSKEENKKDENGGKKDKKLIIMGEELGSGSIWAGKSFFKYFNLLQFEINSSKPKIKNLEYKLIEANDFGGKLEINSNLVLEEDNKKDNKEDENSLLPVRVTTYVYLHKGENPVIEFELRVKNIDVNYDVNYDFNVVFPTKFNANAKENESGIITIWDSKINHGLALFADYGNYTKINSNKGDINLLISTKNQNNSKGFLKTKFALMPLRELDTKMIHQYAEEYFKPLTYKIITQK